jgi:membrane protease subunit (stomatin/prohibitin family)
VEKALDKRTSMGVLGDMRQYTQFQAANAMEAAAGNPGGSAAADGMGLGMGIAMAQQMAQAMGTGAGGAAPPPLPQAGLFFVAVNGQQTGPHAIDALRQQVASGAIARETLVWKQGMPAWAAAAEVPELAALFSAAPPPLPPQ